MAKTSCGITAKMIEVKTWKTGQAAHFRKLIQLDEFKVKIEIKVDSHAPQSFAVASVYNPAKMDWIKLYSIPYPEMETEKGIQYDSKELTAVPFAKDSETLMAGISSILF